MHKKNDIVLYKETPDSEEVTIRILIRKDHFILYGELPSEDYDYYVRAESDGKQFFIKENQIYKKK